MSGFEPIVGKLVTNTIGKASSGDESVLGAQLAEVARANGQLDTAAELRAKRASVKQAVLLKIWKPLGRLAGLPREYFDVEFANDLAERLQDVPEENLTPPPLYIAGPASQGLAFTLEEPDLKSMYLNLIATASDDRVSSTAHPAFAEIIRQLSAEEAQLLRIVLGNKNPNLPIVQVRLKTQESPEVAAVGYNVLVHSMMSWASTDGHQLFNQAYVRYVENWQRLGLVEVDLQSRLTAQGAYEWAEMNPYVVEARARYDTTDFPRIDLGKGVLRITDFGQSFYKAAIEGPAGTEENQGSD